MAKAILISINPKWVKKILNSEKTLEIRKTMPKCDFPIDVYIYCTKGNGVKDFITMYKHDLATDEIGGRYINGTVVAKFTLNKAEEIRISPMFVGGCPHYYLASCKTTKEFYEKSCLDYDTLHDYLQRKVGYAWHIDNLFIFSEPKALSEFATLTKSYKYHRVYDYLTCPPQNWCFVEI